jgi:hypothetical protein
MLSHPSISISRTQALAHKLTMAIAGASTTITTSGSRI